MLGPFPGMDPYLEAPDLWPGVHMDLLFAIAEDLQPQLVPHYVAAKEQRVVLYPLGDEFRPDVHVREREPKAMPGGVAVSVRPTADSAVVPELIDVPEMRRPHRFLAIRDARSHEVVTLIEVLSPWNKREPGRSEYRSKQAEYLLSRANLVEIDLLRGGRPTVAIPEAYLPPSPYRICIHRARPDDPEPGAERFELVRFGLPDVLPDLRIPLRDGDPDAVLHLDAVLTRVYEAGGYAYQVDYSRPAEPPLSPEEAAWARERIGAI